MKKITKWLLIALAVAGAAFIAFNLFLSVKQKDCLEGDGTKAIEACSFLISRSSTGSRPDYLAKRAQLLEKTSEWDKVISDLNELLAMKVSASVPQDRILAAYESLYRTHLKKGDSAEFKKYLELAAQNGSKEPKVYLSLAEIYVEDKKPQEALGMLDTASGLVKVKDHQFYNALASAYEGLNDYEKAYEALKTGLAVSAPRPVLASTAKHLGFVCFELKRYKEAEMYLGYVLKAGQDCPECGLLLTTIRGALEPPDELPAGRAKKKRR